MTSGERIEETVSKASLGLSTRKDIPYPVNEQDVKLGGQTANEILYGCHSIKQRCSSMMRKAEDLSRSTIKHMDADTNEQLNVGMSLFCLQRSLNQR